MFKKIIVNIPRGKDIGCVQSGLMCIPASDLYWQGGKASVCDEEFAHTLREELEKTGYTVVGDPDAIFEDESAWKAEYLIAGQITDMDANICYPNAGYGNLNSAKGEAYIKIEWQIYSRKIRDVVLKLETEGSSKLKSAMPMGDDEVLYQVFAAAVCNMLSKEEFYNLVALDEDLPDRKKAEAEKLPEIKINFKKVTDENDKKKLKEEIVGELSKSVITIFAGDGYGSGFVISEDGYALTAEHVVSGARFVQAKFVTGREVPAEVIRVNKAEDVALVKLETDTYPFLYLGDSSKIDIGSEVYAIGTPLWEELSQTVTMGIVSSFRVEDDIRYIQSDVSVNPGSSGVPLISVEHGVIGICVSSIAYGEIPVGVNYFIPIEEAINTLNIIQQ